MSEDPVIIDDDKPLEFDETFSDSSESTMAAITRRRARKTSWLRRIFMASLGGLIAIAVSLSFWNFVTNLLQSNPVLGLIAQGLGAIIIVIMCLYILREIFAIMRLRRSEKNRVLIEKARKSGALKDAKSASDRIAALYPKSHSDWEKRRDELVDADAILDLCERDFLSEKDVAAIREIQTRARRVALVTAFIPLALADVITVLTSNIGMIRAIADVYGGQPGIIGGWRLFGRIATHLVATGAISVGDDLIGTVMGGSLLSKLSRRFGEGIVNSALTTRIGIAAMEVCRPMPFHALKRPSTSSVLTHSLSGLYTNEKSAP